jgi:acetyl esterase/lipase
MSIRKYAVFSSYYIVKSTPPKGKIIMLNETVTLSEKYPDATLTAYICDNDPELKADPRPAMIVCPGGGYMGKAGHEGAPIAEMFNKGGINAFTLDYNVHPCHKYAPLSDIQRAVRVVRSLGYEKVATLGFSAGGHLCATSGNKCLCLRFFDWNGDVYRFCDWRQDRKFVRNAL